MENTQLDGDRIKLSEAWQRIEGLCQKLWSENSSQAVSLQAVVEEFRGEAQHAEHLVAFYKKSLAEQKEILEKDLAQYYGRKLEDLSEQLKNAQASRHALEQSLTARDREIGVLMDKVQAKEAENLQFHEKYLKAIAQLDESQGQKMEAFYRDLQKRQSELEAAWNLRHEEENRRHKELEDSRDKFLREVREWESRKVEREQALIKKEEELALRASEIAQEYKKKQAELEMLKDGLKREVSDIVRRYQGTNSQ